MLHYLVEGCFVDYFPLLLGFSQWLLPENRLPSKAFHGISVYLSAPTPLFKLFSYYYYVIVPQEQRLSFMKAVS